MAAARAGGGRQTAADISFSSIPTESIGLEIVNKLAAKGFCVIAPQFEEGTLQAVLAEVKDFDADNRWMKVNSIIQEALLGSEGSCNVAELDSPDVEDEARTDGEFLIKMDNTLTLAGIRIEPYLDHLGISVSHRTLALVHKAGEPDEEEEARPLDEQEVMKWLSQFLRHRLMVMVFLGPSTGTLELQPYDHDDAEPHEVTTPPGTIVVLRPDLMSHRHYCNGQSVAISTFFLQGHLHKRMPQEGMNMIPAARELDEWTMNRLRELKETVQEDAAWDPAIPRDWQQAMNHIFHKGQMVAVRGMALKFPKTEDVDEFWQASNAGPDLVVEVPMLRWNHAEKYDPDLESWRNFKTYCKHGSFMDGIELFDCKMFSMSPNEAKSMDPHQRLILELGYKALFNMGMRKNTLVNTACGVYVGQGNNEWGATPKEQDFGAFGATGGALSISSGRFSFTLGLKGPSMTLDTEASAGATALYLAAEAVQKKGRAVSNDFSLAIGANVMLAAEYWPLHCANGWLSFEGRCLTFNASAAGYVRGDGCAGVALKNLTEYVEGNYVSSEDNVMGAIAGAMMNNNGRGASLAAPHGPAEQEAVAEAVRNAGISPYDVDAVEAFGCGSFLGDAIEVSSMARSHRSEEVKDPLVVTAVKTTMGNQVEASGIAAFIKVVNSAMWGSMTPNLHLETANPHMEAFDLPCALASEALEYKMHSSFTGVMSRGNGGSNTYILVWGQINRERFPAPEMPSSKDMIRFWPGGGGALEDEQRPNYSYAIVGSWSEWRNPAVMEVESPGVYTFTMTLGENRWEAFQIWLDGDSTRRLHPGKPRASKDFPVEGPDEDAAENTWMIDGRVEYAYVPQDDTTSKEGATQIVTDDFGQEVAIFAVPTADVGSPGDQYRIRLRIAGKWRNVSWERLSRDGQLEDAPAATTRGRYYVAGSWSDWDMEPMTADTVQEGLFYKDVTFDTWGGEFQIVRNMDWDQAIYPTYSRATSDEAEILGPAESAPMLTWYLNAQRHQTYRIEFYRQVGGDIDTKKVSWRRIDNQAPRPALTAGEQ